MISTKLVLKKNKIDSNGKAPIYLRINKNRKTVYINSKLKCQPSLWIESKQKLKSQYPNSTMANSKLRNLQHKAEKEALELERIGKSYSASMVKEKVLNQNSNDLIKYGYDWVTKRRENKSITYSTSKRYCSIISKLKDYCHGYCRIDQFDIDLIEGFETYLRTTCKNSPNTICANMACLRAIANSLIQDGIMNLNDYPFARYKFKYVESNREYLSLEELDQIQKLDVPHNSRIEKCRDIFLFCSYTGLRIGDALHLKKNDFTGSHINYYCQKIKSYENLKLTHKALHTIEPYIRICDQSNDFVFPFLKKELMSNEVTALKNQKSCTALINKYLKIIGERIGTDKSISSHIGRHSMSTNALLKGLSLVEIKGILGHRDIKSTQIYAKVVDSLRDQAIDKLND